MRLQRAGEAMIWHSEKLRCEMEQLHIQISNVNLSNITQILLWAVKHNLIIWEICNIFGI